MPAISTKIVLNSAAQSANTVLADIDLIKGALYGVSTETDLDNIHANYLQDGQLMFVQDVAKFFSLTITPANPPTTFVDTFEWEEVTLGASGAITSDDTGSFVLNSQTGSFLTSADTSSFVLVSDTSSMSVATASYIDPTFISASAAASGFGAGGGSTDISALNTFTASIQTEVDSLTSATSSYLTSADTGSFITSDVTSSMSVATASFVSDTFISASAARSGFGSGGSEVGGIFIQTGSFYATTNDLQVTGSMTISNGSLILNEFDSLPSVDRGGIIFSSGQFYIGVD